MSHDLPNLVVPFDSQSEKIQPYLHQVLIVLTERVVSLESCFSSYAIRFVSFLAQIRKVTECQDFVTLDSVWHWHGHLIDCLCNLLCICMKLFAKLMDPTKRSDDFLLHNNLCVKCDKLMTGPDGFPNCSTVSTKERTSFLYLTCKLWASSWWTVLDLGMSKTTSNSSRHLEQSGPANMKSVSVSGSQLLHRVTVDSCCTVRVTDPCQWG